MSVDTLKGLKGDHFDLEAWCCLMIGATLKAKICSRQRVVYFKSSTLLGVFKTGK